MEGGSEVEECALLLTVVLLFLCVAAPPRRCRRRPLRRCAVPLLRRFALACCCCFDRWPSHATLNIGIGSLAFIGACAASMYSSSSCAAASLPRSAAAAARRRIAALRIPRCRIFSFWKLLLCNWNWNRWMSGWVGLDCALGYMNAAPPSSSMPLLVLPLPLLPSRHFVSLLPLHFVVRSFARSVSSLERSSSCWLAVMPAARPSS